MEVEYDAIQDEMGETKTVKLQLPKEQWVRLHAETMDPEVTVEEILEEALRLYERRGGFDAGKEVSR